MIEFLNPFLWGFILSSIPIFIYLYKRITKKTLILPTLKLIDEKEKSKGVRINLEILKVILRVIIISLIVLIFSQPVISRIKTNQTFILLDTTYSAKDNFNKYLSFLREYISNLPSGTEITLIDMSGTKISGTKEEVLDKIKTYHITIGKLDKKVIEELKGKEIILLSDGQKNFLELLNQENIKFKLIKFPFSIPNVEVNIIPWKKIGSPEAKLEIIPKEKTLVEISLTGEREIKLSSMELSSRKVIEIKLTNSEGISFLNVKVIKNLKTNNFVYPFYFFDNKINLVAEKEEYNFIEKALNSIDIKVDKTSKYSIIVSDFLNADKIRNSVIIPKKENSKIIFRNKNLFSKGENGKLNNKIEKYNFTYLPIKPIKELNMPENVRLVGM
ncbi:MAG: BatA domain-containing protein, partial [Brevinematia bacterium]